MFVEFVEPNHTKIQFSSQRIANRNVINFAVNNKKVSSRDYFLKLNLLNSEALL